MKKLVSRNLSWIVQTMIAIVILYAALKVISGYYLQLASQH